ncbi:MAG TPA: 30S ribosomal protein S16 [Acidimicrobiia bacterium]|nr:30S ribosomal protein S16 [Acidimicrobiia bacterium]
MAVKMRLIRMGKKKSPVYRVVVVDGRSPRDGRYIEQIGRYDPRQEPSLVEIDNDKATRWLAKGAQPTEAVEKLLNISGALSTMKVKRGQVHVVAAAAQSQEEEPETAPLAPTHEEAAAQATVVEEPVAHVEPVEAESVAAAVPSEEE